jgi:hypothetical protein
VLSQDVESLVPDVLRHRMNLSYEAMSQGKTADALIQQVMLVIKPPAAEKTNANGTANPSEQQAIAA